MSAKKTARKENILNRLLVQSRVTSEQLCDELGASKATIRRDLTELEAEGRVERIRGGARISRDSSKGMSQAKTLNTCEKLTIAKAASSLVTEGETIFVGSGTTVAAMIPFLQTTKALTVVTNALNVADALQSIDSIELVLIGGIIRRSDHSAIGHIAEKSLAEIRTDRVFVGAEAIDLKAGLTNSDLTKTRTDRAILALSQNTTLVADHTKFNQVRTAFLAPLTAIHTLITDWRTSQKDISSIQQLGVNVIVCPEDDGHISN